MPPKNENLKNEEVQIKLFSQNKSLNLDQLDNINFIGYKDNGCYKIPLYFVQQYLWQTFVAPIWASLIGAYVINTSNVFFSMPTLVKDGVELLLLNGQTLSTKEYPKLAEAMGVNPSTNASFTLPNLSNLYLKNLNSYSHQIVGSIHSGNLPAHKHNMLHNHDMSHDHTYVEDYAIVEGDVNALYFPAPFVHNSQKRQTTGGRQYTGNSPVSTARFGGDDNENDNIAVQLYIIAKTYAV